MGSLATLGILENDCRLLILKMSRGMKKPGCFARLFL
jgi:hypothetical protein